MLIRLCDGIGRLHIDRAAEGVTLEWVFVESSFTCALTEEQGRQVAAQILKELAGDERACVGCGDTIPLEGPRFCDGCNEEIKNLLDLEKARKRAGAADAS